MQQARRIHGERPEERRQVAGRRHNLADIPWTQPIDRAEFLRRAGYCTVAAWPRPLLDEPDS